MNDSPIGPGAAGQPRRQGGYGKGDKIDDRYEVIKGIGRGGMGVVYLLCHFTMSNEVFGGVNIDYLRPAKATSHGDDRIRVAGTTGVIEVFMGGVRLIDERGPQELPLEPKREIFAEFIDQVQGTATSLISAEDAFLTTKACLLARQSADEGRVVNF